MNDEGMEEEESHDNQTNGGGSSAAHGSTTNTPKEIKFNVHHKYTTYNVTILDRSTIGEPFNYFAISMVMANNLYAHLSNIILFQF